MPSGSSSYSALLGVKYPGLELAGTCVLELLYVIRMVCVAGIAVTVVEVSE